MAKSNETTNMKERYFSAKMGRRGFSAGSRQTPISLQSSQKKVGTAVLNKFGLRKIKKIAETQSRQVGTPRSGCSSSVTALEETIADVMGVRMQSLTDLGARIEELSSIHRQEEVAFRQQMDDVLQQLETARVNQLGTEQDYEALLKKERQERQTVISLMQRFKTEGAEVINTMKESLKAARTKWKAEVELNAQLTAQLRQYQMNIMPLETTKTDSAGNLKPGSNENALYTKVEILTRLLEEEDTIIVELQERNKALEKKVSVLTQQRNRLLDLEAQHLETEEFNTEYSNLLSAVRGFETAEEGTPLEGRVSVLTRFTKMLLQRLQSEQRQRLRVEEQAVRMASEHDQIVRALEARIKSLEIQKSGGAPSYRQNVLHTENEQSCKNLLTEGISEVPPRSDGAHPKRDQSVGQEEITSYAGVNDFRLLLNSSKMSGAKPLSEEKVPNVPTGDAEHEALEAQLAAVTSDFQQSVAEWIAFPLNAEKTLREDFCPE
ncbi:hypothetical protein MOQ_003386 [Trypanosoma cruzi marinkellei]|uniref:Uncharacterized protein n=1 Tax=Trypanosoma cruzi marinkellei TaxID=85056 RepID=K2N4A2_TRYCR|nr:hypothetical protein MOQ_003386 [Trypanosoma cruzi marinkellei]